MSNCKCATCKVWRELSEKIEKVEVERDHWRNEYEAAERNWDSEVHELDKELEIAKNTVLLLNRMVVSGEKHSDLSHDAVDAVIRQGTVSDPLRRQSEGG